ncbi:MAG: DUF1015 domain-containing protein [Candidatus Margulisiibacteriota bacterium]
MAIIEPFAAYRYNKGKVNKFENVITQPYDKIPHAMQKEYYQKSPYNLVRIIKGHENGDDYEGRDKYQMAGYYLNEWIKKGILVKDAAPAIYYYTQTFITESGKKKTRSGFIGLGKLDENKVHAHEHTLSGPKKDRLKLLRATRANFGQIFMLYDDPADNVNKLLLPEVHEKEPDILTHDEDGNEHRLWAIKDPGLIQEVKYTLKDKELFIADGHHRYETAVNYMNEMKEKGQYIPEMNYRMMTFINMADPGLVILPTHRCVHNLENYNFDNLIEELSKYFDLCRTSDLETHRIRLNERAKNAHAIGMYANSGYYMLTLKDISMVDSLFDTDTSAAYRHLDVSILHKLILEKILGITIEDQAAQKNLVYVRYCEPAIERVDRGDSQLCFFLNPTKVSEVREIASKGERMPQKSTDFYPKLLSGITIYKMDK